MRRSRVLAPAIVSVGLAAALMSGCGDDNAKSTVSSLSQTASSIADQAVSAASSTATSIGNTASSMASSMDSTTTMGGTTTTTISTGSNSTTTNAISNAAGSALGELVKASLTAAGKPYNDTSKIRTAVDRIPGSPTVTGLDQASGGTVSQFQVTLAGQKACLQVTPDNISSSSC